APDRERRLLGALLRQGIEVYRVDADFAPRGAVGALGQAAPASMHRGTYLVPAAQPNGALAHALLDFDPRMTDAFLVQERQELTRKGETRLFDVTAWDLGRAFAVDAWWVDEPAVARTQVTSPPDRTVGAAGGNGPPPYAWIVDGRDDGSVAFAGRALELGVRVRVADEPFLDRGSLMPRGTVVVLRADNPGDIHAQVDAAARAAGVPALAAQTGRAQGDGPDLGGHHFHLLERPRIAVLTGAPIDPGEVGHVWHELDQELGVPFTMIDAQYLGTYDLRRYSVLVVPGGGRGLGGLLQGQAKALQTWVADGGTLIALGEAAELVTGTDMGLTQVKTRADALTELELYAAAAKADLDARDIRVDPHTVWDGRRPSPAAKDKAKGDDDAGDDELSKQQEQWASRFAPHGVIARGLVAEHEWITFGTGAELPVPADGGAYLMARPPVHAPIRLAPP
ncbi:MAG TPA: hypothetical protein VFF36_07795, partial [Planctomycetota bacterium]|nr:hypothetical protein [Planctomycetota bacterium]